MAGPTQPRLTDLLYANAGIHHSAVVTATEPGIAAGFGLLDSTNCSFPAGQWRIVARDGEVVRSGQVLVEVSGSAAELATAEDFVLGPIGFASGLATVARRFVEAAPTGLRVVCGGWKKLPAAAKPLLRAAIAAAGVAPRLLNQDFLYLDKNAVRLLGGIAATVRAGLAVGHGAVAVQIKNAEDAAEAARAGAAAVMVDTGSIEDLSRAHDILIGANLRGQVTLAYAGGVKLDELARIRSAGADVVDVGRGILDAPLMDLRFDVVD
jgi:nicotinate-nucleotide pyrophosphorylase (carboxylating)